MDLVQQMDKIINDNWIYTQLVNEKGIAAHSPSWGGLRRPGARVQLRRVHQPAPEVWKRRTGRGQDDRACNAADYIMKRTLFALLTVFVAVTLNFVLFRALPGDAVSGLKCRACTVQFKKALRHDLGLDKSKWQQYVLYLKDLAHGDLGMIVRSRTSPFAASCGIRSRTRSR